MEESVYVCFCAFMMSKSAIFLILFFFLLVYVFVIFFLWISSPLLTTLSILIFFCNAESERATGDWFCCCRLEDWE